MVKRIRTWETVYFEASKKGVGAVTIELTLNHQLKTFDLCTARQEMVRFNKDTIEEAKLRVKALKAAIDYAERSLTVV